MSTTVHLELWLDPARLDDAPTVIDETLVATRAWPGCESLEVIIDDADPAHLIVVERWATTADHTAYAAWRQTPEGRHRLGELLAAPSVKRIYSTSLPLTV